MSEIGGKCMEDILKPNEMYEDNNHPNELGHRIWYQVAREKIDSINIL